MSVSFTVAGRDLLHWAGEGIDSDADSNALRLAFTLHAIRVDDSLRIGQDLRDYYYRETKAKINLGPGQVADAAGYLLGLGDNGSTVNTEARTRSRTDEILRDGDARRLLRRSIRRHAAKLTKALARRPAGEVQASSLLRINADGEEETQGEALGRLAFRQARFLGIDMESLLVELAKLDPRTREYFIRALDTGELAPNGADAEYKYVERQLDNPRSALSRGARRAAIRSWRSAKSIVTVIDESFRGSLAWGHALRGEALDRYGELQEEVVRSLLIEDPNKNGDF